MAHRPPGQVVPSASECVSTQTQTRTHPHILVGTQTDRQTDTPGFCMTVMPGPKTSKLECIQ